MSNSSGCDVIMHSCLICLDSQSRGYVRLKEGKKWLERLEYCFNIKLTAEEKPLRVCYKCAVKLKKFCMFKAKCLSSLKLWKYHTVVKCRVDRIQFKEAKCDFSTDDERNQNIENIDNLNYCIPSNNSIYSEYTKEILDNVIKDTDLLFKKEDEDSIQDKIIPSKDNFTCKRCSKSYTTNRWYVRHLELCKADGDFLPNTTCHYIKTNSSVISKTYKASENIEQQTSTLLTHLCGICQFSSTNFEDVNKHLDEHWINNESQCLMCEFIAKDQAGLAAHRYNHNESKSLYYLCHICQKKTKSQLSLQFHYRKDHLNKPGGLCSQPKCNKEYNCWRMWKKHEKVHLHPGYICDFCGQKYKYKHLIMEHLINHTSPSTHVCDVCGKVFSQIRSLKVHIKAVHQSAEPVKCSHCNRVFKNPLRLRLHQKRITRQKTLKCEFCSMEYSMLSELNSHLKSHSEERPHCCHICDSRYKAKSQLVIHMRNHTGDRPYKCILCVKEFKSGTQLKVHTMSHTGILPFKCLYCEKSFRSKKRMLGHCAVQHKSLE